MDTTSSPPFSGAAQTPIVHQGWFARAEHWLDARGKAAWIAAIILGFIAFWPIGLALLAYMIWRSPKGANCHRRQTRHGFESSGNSAFDAYKADTLKRLEEEQGAFEAFLDRLRDAKDKSEFDDFMEDRAKAAKAGRDAPEA